MSITIEGNEAEAFAREFLKSINITNIQQFDWFIKLNNKYYILEVKSRQLYQPPPFLGTGLDIKQLNLRRQVFNDLGIDTILFVVDKENNKIYYQSIFNYLEKTKFFDTKNKIRIYNIEHFKSTSKC